MPNPLQKTRLLRQFKLQSKNLEEKIFTTQTATTLNATDSTAYEMGLRFTSAVPGRIMAIRYWRATSETGSHTGRIWNSSGTQLTSVVFTGESSSGWQEQALSSPLAIAANTTYTVSANINSHYVSTTQGLASSINSGNLTALAGGGRYGSIGIYPITLFNNNNYFRDIVFVAD